MMFAVDRIVAAIRRKPRIRRSFWAASNCMMWLCEGNGRRTFGWKPDEALRSWLAGDDYTR